jgi:hypothetical protein
VEKNNKMKNCKELRIELGEIKTLKKEFDFGLGRIRAEGIKDVISLKEELIKKIEELAEDLPIFKKHDQHDSFIDLAPESISRDELKRSDVLKILKQSMEIYHCKPADYVITSEKYDGNNNIIALCLSDDSDEEANHYRYFSFYADSLHNSESFIEATWYLQDSDIHGHITEHAINEHLCVYKNGGWQY